MALQLNTRDTQIAVRELARRRQVDELDVWTAIADALELAWRRQVGDKLEGGVDIDIDSGTITVVDADGHDITPHDFGRIAATVFKGNVATLVDRVMHSRAAQRFAGRVGELVTGVVKHSDERRTLVDIEGVEAVLPARLAIRGERWDHGDQLTAVVEAVRHDGVDVVTLSRASDQFIDALLRTHISSIASGDVDVVSIARVPGRQTKIVVAPALNAAGHPLIRDAVGAVIGRGGTTISGVSAALGRERVDVIAYDPDPRSQVAGLLGVDVSRVEAADSGWVVDVAPSERRRLIGHGGVNVRLVEQLTGSKITVSGPGGRNVEAPAA